MLQRLKWVSLSLILAGASVAAPLAAGAQTRCDSTDTLQGEPEPPLEIGFRSERHGDTCLYVYTVLNLHGEPITAVQVGYDAGHDMCELTAARPHAPPDTAYSPTGWVCTPLQSDNSSTFTLGWRLDADREERSGATDTLISGFAVALPRPDSLYENSHWLVRVKGLPSRMAYVGQVRPEVELDFARPGTGTISGKVTDIRGAAISHPDIFVKGAFLRSVSRSDGTYLISDVPAGTITLAARTRGYQPCRKRRVRVAANDTTRVDFRLSDAAASTPCAPYSTYMSQVGVPFPGADVDTLGARFLDRHTRIPARQPGDASAARPFIYSLTDRDVEIVYRGLGQDSVRRAFVASLHRNYRNAEEEHLVRIAEETYPPPEAILAIADRNPGRAALANEKRLWWYGEFDGVRLPYAVTMDAIRYYLSLAQSFGRGDSTQTHGIRMKRCEFNYYVNISQRPETFSRDGRVFEDVYVVEMGMHWSNYCSPECACFFSLDRTVVLRRDGTVLCVFGDQKTKAVVS